MSIQNRPNAVTVVAVLNFIFGGMGLIGTLCMGAMFAAIPAMVKNMPPMPDGSPNPLKGLVEVYTDAPGAVPFLIGTTVMGFIMAIVLIASGFGLLKLKNWARIACFVYAIYTILATVGGAVFQFTVIDPAMQKWVADVQKQAQQQAQKKGGPAPAPAPPPMAGGGVGGLLGSVVGIAYPIAILIILNLAHVREAFRTGGAVAVDREAEEGWGDVSDRYRGDDRGRLRSDDDRIQG